MNKFLLLICVLFLWQCGRGGYYFLDDVDNNEANQTDGGTVVDVPDGSNLDDDLVTDSEEGTEGSLEEEDIVSEEEDPGPQGWSLIIVGNDTGTDDDDFSVLRLEHASGQVRELSMNQKVVGWPRAVIIHPTLFVVYFQGWNLFQYVIDPQSGIMTPLAPDLDNFASAGCTQFAIHSSLRSLYWGGDGPGGNLFQYDIDPLTGELTPKVNVIVTSQSLPGSIALIEEANIAIVTNTNPQSTMGLSSYTIDPVTEELTYQSPWYPTPTVPRRIVVTPSGEYLYASFPDGDTIVQYQVDLVTAELSVVSEYVVDQGPFGLAMHPSGSWLFVSYSGADKIGRFQVDPNTGALSELVPVAEVGDQPTDTQLTLDGSYLLVINSSSNDLATYRVDPTNGSLEEILPRIITGENPISLAVSSRDID
jgi:hypothetical protein